LRYSLAFSSLGTPSSASSAYMIPDGFLRMDEGIDIVKARKLGGWS
jgi:hypothetical protein